MISCHLILKDNSKTSTRTDRQNAIVVFALSDLLSGTNEKHFVLSPHPSPHPSPKQITRPWVSGQDNSGKPDPHPHLIWYDFVSSSVFPLKISFLPRRDGNEEKMDRTPTAFQLIASNDKVCSGDSSWNVLCEDQHAPAINKDHLATIDDERGWSTT